MTLLAFEVDDATPGRAGPATSSASLFRSRHSFRSACQLSPVVPSASLDGATLLPPLDAEAEEDDEGAAGAAAVDDDDDDAAMCMMFAIAATDCAETESTPMSVRFSFRRSMPMGMR